MREKVRNFAFYLMDYSQKWEKRIETVRSSKVPQQRSFLAKRLDAYSWRFLLAISFLLLMAAAEIKWWQAMALTAVAAAMLYLLNRSLEQNKPRLYGLKAWKYSSSQVLKRAKALFAAGTAFLILAMIGQEAWKWYWGGIGTINLFSAGILWAEKSNARAG